MLIVHERPHEERVDFYKLLIENGANIDHELDYCKTLLMEACEEEDFDFVRYLVEHGANINKNDGDGNTAISFLPRLEGEIFDYLVANGGSINENVYEGYTALQEAVIERNYARIQNLLDRGADINHMGYVDETPLMLAGNDSQMLEYLLERGADPYIINEDGSKMII